RKSKRASKWLGFLVNVPFWSALALTLSRRVWSTSLRLPRSHPPRELSVVSPEHYRSEEHTSELQSLTNLVCRLLLEKKNTILLLVLFWQWRPVGGIIWDVHEPTGRLMLRTLYGAGVLVLLSSSDSMNHYDRSHVRRE